LYSPPNDSYYQTGKLIFFDAAPNFEKLQSIRSIANTMLGVSYYLRSNPTDDDVKKTLASLSATLINHYRANSTPDWKWFESLLAYDNGMLPLALLHAAEILEDEKIAHIALEATHFLTGVMFKEGYLSIIGNEKWFKKEGERSVFAQQPVDALAMVLLYRQAYHVTKDKTYLTQLFACFMWFLGENDIRISLFDFETKGCCDGIERYGVNRNQGAESSLAYLISHLVVMEAFDALEQRDVRR
jgi:hypothetical protein